MITSSLVFTVINFFIQSLFTCTIDLLYSRWSFQQVLIPSTGTSLPHPWAFHEMHQLNFSLVKSLLNTWLMWNGTLVRFSCTHCLVMFKKRSLTNHHHSVLAPAPLGICWSVHIFRWSSCLHRPRTQTNQIDIRELVAMLSFQLVRISLSPCLHWVWQTRRFLIQYVIDKATLYGTTGTNVVTGGCGSGGRAVVRQLEGW